MQLLVFLVGKTVSTVTLILMLNESFPVFKRMDSLSLPTFYSAT